MRWSKVGRTSERHARRITDAGSNVNRARTAKEAAEHSRNGALIDQTTISYEHALTERDSAIRQRQDAIERGEVKL